MDHEIRLGDCRALLPELGDGSVDSVVTDPPYELGFMGKSWDRSGIAYQVGVWGEVLRVLRPGGHLLAFGGTRTHHRLACAIEDAGFEIRDSIDWVYGSGFPKSLDVSKAIDAEAGAERQIIGKQRLGGNALVPCKEKGGTYAVGVGVAPPGEIDITAKHRKLTVILAAPRASSRASATSRRRAGRSGTRGSRTCHTAPAGS